MQRWWHSLQQQHKLQFCDICLEGRKVGGRGQMSGRRLVKLEHISLGGGM